MIYTLYSLKKIYSDKKVYVWNINRDSMGVFLKVALMGIDIQGFVAPQDEYVGEEYMNRPVISPAQIEQDTESIVLIADTVPEEAYNMILPAQRALWKDSLEIREELRSGKIIIYGTGQGCEQLCKALREERIEAELFCVTKKNDSTHYKGKEVIESAELDQYEDFAVLVSVLSPWYREEILNELTHFSGKVYIELANIMDRPEDLINFVQNLDLAVREKRKIYLYGERNLVAGWIESILHIYGIRIDGYVCDIDDEEQEIKNIYELAYEGIEDKLIIINEDIPAYLSEARKHIELAGFSLENGNYTSLKQYTYVEQFMLSELREYPDSLCGDSIIYSQGEPGWRLYGKNDVNSIRILVVGGSTSSEIYHTENWISKLYCKLSQNNIKVAIYNGAHACNDIVSEILRVLRDGYVLKPHIVISMSGVNNTYYKKGVNQFNEERLIWRVSNRREGYCSGVKSEETLFSFWRRNVELLKLISEFYGTRFFGILQPMNITMKHMDIREKSLYEREMRVVGAEDFSKSADADKQDIYNNLMRLFEHRDEMYFDICHYTNKGHDLIADEVYKIIEPTVMELVKQKHGKMREARVLSE